MINKRKTKKRSKFDIVVVPVEGDPIQAISNALEPSVIRVLRQHNAYLKMPLVDILRNHARPQPVKCKE